MHWKRPIIALCIVLALAAFSEAQDLPASQPDVLLIQIEEIKLGHGVAHRANESDWVKAYEKAGSKDSYITLQSMTGTSEVWYVNPYASHRAMDESFMADSKNAELSAELGRLALADADHLTSARTVHLAARKDLSYGAYPDVSRMRFWEITRFRVRPGGEAAFAAAAKAYAAAAMRAAPKTSFRVYEVAAGLPAPTYFVFSSIPSFADFDTTLAEGMATMKALNPQEQEAMDKFAAALINSETHRYRLDPDMSFVSKAVRESDPAFWLKK